MEDFEKTLQAWNQAQAELNQLRMQTNLPFVQGRRSFARYMYYQNLQELRDKWNAGEISQQDLQKKFFIHHPYVPQHDDFFGDEDDFFDHNPSGTGVKLTLANQYVQPAQPAVDVQVHGRVVNWPTKHTWVDYREKHNPQTNMVDVHILFRHRARAVYSQYRTQIENPNAVQLIWDALIKWNMKKVPKVDVDVECEAFDWLDIKHWRQKCDTLYQTLENAKGYVRVKKHLSEIGFAKFAQEVADLQYKNSPLQLAGFLRFSIHGDECAMRFAWHTNWHKPTKKFQKHPHLADELWDYLLNKPVKGWAQWVLEGKELPPPPVH